MPLRLFCLPVFLLSASALPLVAQTLAALKPPIVNDPALKIELLVGTPEVEACTTVCGAPDGSFYVGNDPRDGRLATSQPVNTIVRFSSMQADRRRTVFADKLYSPAGSTWHDGWLYVIHDPLMTRFKDTDGDGIADVREDLVTNLGLPPNEGLNDHVVSGFTLGMDGFFYISVGDRGIYQAKSVRDGSTITMQGGGIARCRTDGTQLEVFSTGTRNHLQVNLDAEDNAFTRDNTDDGNGWWTRLTHHIEGGYYGYPHDYRAAPNYGVTQPSQQTLDAIKQHGGTGILPVGPAGVLPAPDAPQQAGSLLAPQAGSLCHTFLPAMADFGPGSPTGGLCYLSDGLPEKYRGKHFFSEWGKQGIYVTDVARDGATFKLVSDTKLIEPEKGGDFRPMQLSVASDGSVLIADWGYGGWKSPKVAGAIWRLSWPDAKPAPRLTDESKATVENLFAALGHPDRDQRLRAQWALVSVTAGVPPAESGTLPGGLPKITAGVKMKDRSGETPEPAGGTPILPERLVTLIRAQTTQPLQRMHALWAFREITCTPEILAARDEVVAVHKQFGKSVAVMAQCLEDSLPSIRMQAVRVLMIPRVGVRKFSYLAVDPDPSVRRQVAAGMGAAQDPQGSPFHLIQCLTDDDPWVRFAVRAALRKLGTVRAIVDAMNSEKPGVSEQGWAAIQDWFSEECIEALAQRTKVESAGVRAAASSALGRIAYQPKPYDGHWWGTQPVKSPPPLNGVAWAGTAPALAALTEALGDADAGVRLAAAKAFSQFREGEVPDGPKLPAGTTQPADKLGLAGTLSLPALRARLTTETDAGVRRQLIESLGVQKDPLAMDVFRQIALDEKADAEFRETAIGAVVNLGGDAAKKVIAQLADAKLSPAATLQIITAAGALKVLEAAPALIAHLKDENAGNREFAARSLQQLGPKSAAGPALVEALADKDNKVLAAAIEALGGFREKAALPALIAFAQKKKFMKEALNALANMPDESAIPVLVETLRDKNTGARRSAIKALKTMREKARPQVEALLVSGRVPEELVPEIKDAFESGAIVQWKMVGVFENVWEAVHPPEADVLGSPLAGQAGRLSSGAGASLLAKKYHNAEGHDVGWIDVTADATEGRVDLQKVFKTSAMVCAYAFTEIDAPEAAEAKLFTSADDELAVWLNGRQILNLSGSHGYEPDRNETALRLRAGKNQLFVKIGNKSGSWVFHARIPGFENGRFLKWKDPAPEEKQRLFALAAKPDGAFINAGNAKAGEKLFFDTAGAMGGICATCHAVGAKGGQIGPALTTVGANYKRADLITSLHEPSKTVALGFEQVLLETTGGETIAGSLRAESGEAWTIVDAAGQSRVVKKAEVKTKTDLHVSLMPPGLTLGLKPEEFADLLAYLESLKG